MLATTSFALGCKLAGKTSGIIFTKTGPDRWEPSAEGQELGEQPFFATDQAVLASNDLFRPAAIRASSSKNR